MTALAEVQAVVAKWRRYASEVGVPRAWQARIEETLRLGL